MVSVDYQNDIMIVRLNSSSMAPVHENELECKTSQLLNDGVETIEYGATIVKEETILESCVKLL